MFMMAASAATLSFDTAVGSGFNHTTNWTLFSTSGEAATLKFLPNGGNVSGVPTNANFGTFVLTCATCTPFDSPSAKFAGFQPFTFDLYITDLTDGATGRITGTSQFLPVASPALVYHNVSPIRIIWSPLVLGPGQNGAISGSFGPTTFTTFNPTLIVGPISGTLNGNTTIQGFVDSGFGPSGQVPEPATLGLVGATLVGLGMFGRKKTSSQ
ncbi:MAG TPA: PEP-CTERM sorting domain-containing protein [Paludibaculum sp.]|jgi:hypothetical protein